MANYIRNARPSRGPNGPIFFPKRPEFSVFSGSLSTGRKNRFSVAAYDFSRPRKKGGFRFFCPFFRHRRPLTRKKNISAKKDFFRVFFAFFDPPAPKRNFFGTCPKTGIPEICQKIARRKTGNFTSPLTMKNSGI